MNTNTAMPETIMVGTTKYVRNDKVEEDEMAVAGSAGAGGEELTVQEVCPVYRLGKSPEGRLGQISNLALSFTTMPVTKIKPGMKLALRVVL